jgi:hypothetical protein
LMDFQWNWDLFPTNKLLCWDGYSFIPKPANFFEDSHSYDFPAQGSWQGVLSCSGPEAIQLHEGPHSSMHQKKGWSGWICCIAICGELSQWTLQIASSLSQGCLFWLGRIFFCVFRAVFVLHQLSRFQCNGTCESPQSKPMALPLSSNQTLK